MLIAAILARRLEGGDFAIAKSSRYSMKKEFQSTISMRHSLIPSTYSGNNSMKRYSTILIAIVGLTLLPSHARAQEHEGCFLVDPKGRVIELEGLCATPEVPSQEAANGLPPVPGIPSANVGDGIIRVPIKYRAAGTPVVDVKFNGAQTFEMLVDTGATGTVITPAMADALGVEETGTAIVSTASAREVEMPLGLVQSIDVGGVTIQDVEVGISDALDLGLLGQDLLGQYDITIRNDVIEFHAR